jgi:lipoprotein-releasing system ATP-binding protein
MSKILELQNISKKYSQGSSTIEILKDINFTISQGQLISIIGSSGSGKSTLLHIMGLLDRLSSGNIYLENQQINNASDSVKTNLRLHYFGFIYQHHYLLSNFNARENIALANQLLQGDYALALKEADKWLDRLGLSSRKYNLAAELSGGEQQRVSIARALINKPKLILADEPTGNLDPENATEVFNLFLDLVKETNVAAIIVTHNMELAAQADETYRLTGGRLQLLS